MVKELLLGDNPFIGVSHLAQEKSRKAQYELTIEKKMEVVRAAMEAGATGFTFSTHPANLELLKYIKQQQPNILNKLNYYILIPYTAGYVREATKMGAPRLVRKILTTSLSKRTILSVIPPTPINFIKLFVETEFNEYLKILPRNNIKAVLLHEVLTELIAAFNIPNAIRSLAKHFNERGIGFGLETRNIMHIKSFLEENNLKIDYVMTPMNPLGYQMTPSREAAENAILELSTKSVKIIAINVLASGAVNSIEEALSYLKNFRDNVYAIAVGTSKAHRATTTFTKLLNLVT